MFPGSTCPFDLTDDCQLLGPTCAIKNSRCNDLCRTEPTLFDRVVAEAFFQLEMGRLLREESWLSAGCPADWPVPL